MNDRGRADVIDSRGAAHDNAAASVRGRVVQRS